MYMPTPYSSQGSSIVARDLSPGMPNSMTANKDYFKIRHIVGLNRQVSLLLSLFILEGIFIITMTQMAHGFAS
jgi:hypothetical protein